MRHLKFRVWDFKDKKFHQKIMVGNTNPEQDNYTCPIIHDGNSWLNIPCDAKDMAGEISQWTNFTDNNGNDIYDGDHVALDGLTREVYYNKYMGQWECRTLASIEGVARILNLSYCVATGYLLNGHKWS